VVLVDLERLLGIFVTTWSVVRGPEAWKEKRRSGLSRPARGMNGMSICLFDRCSFGFLLMIAGVSLADDFTLENPRVECDFEMKGKKIAHDIDLLPQTVYSSKG
jgi:hypothetical protein